MCGGVSAKMPPPSCAPSQVINRIRDAFDLVVISLDWHPFHHCSFVESANAGQVALACVRHARVRWSSRMWYGQGQHGACTLVGGWRTLCDYRTP